MEIRKILTYFFSGIVLLIGAFSLAAIWEIIPWSFIEKYIGKIFQSFAVIGICSVVLYLIQMTISKRAASNS
jgi:uncharacterized membrane protein YraQ (UPF0718 family)